MAKKTATTKPAQKKRVVLTERDKKTMAALVGLADGVVMAAEKKRDPFLDIPSRTLSNVKYSPRKGILEMGSGKNRRQLFDLSQAKAYMRTMLVAKGCKELLDVGKSSSLRGLYYMLKHKIAETKENTFDDQNECDTIIEDVEVLLSSIREELHLYAENRGAMVGGITLTDRGDTIDCRRMGSGGYAIPSIVEPGIIELDPKKCDAKFILHVEKGTVWQRFNEDRFWEQHNCILTHGAGQPPRGVRRLLHRMHNELKLPIYCVLDNDPWGYYIYSVIKQGSINLAFESQRMAIPEAKYLGLRSLDFDRCELSDDVIIGLSDTDRKRAKQVAKYPWFEKKRDWQREIERMLKNDFKLEVESLMSKDISYVTETYVPERLAAKDWLD
ncbi:DNA topoisomerase IV subunit A [Botrimarina mediterranea]|uniref:Type 2 DNA topoisomerase 6 subunit A n=1 Tax=Botrimarina mediterranea TaxID=2528022 RepID=A0A518KE82_9BACT|nr:DNA topoisomerase IV subunit A [Botrimarina mediterranea]QDV76101.1 DNA topoisomerase VI subunit A [Botrimarina mediterranea]QDV80699.1 DNA topoisomerase VI subunit A [Planctomycetes bacterium K2D]